MAIQTKDFIRVLITGVGHPIANSVIESLRQNKNTEFYIVGVDIAERGEGFNWVDKHYIIPSATSLDYVQSIKDICHKEGIDIVVPWSDDEVVAISSSALDFHKLGIATLCSPFQSVQLVVDKAKMLEELKQTDIPIPKFEIASSPEDIEQAAKRLGYPENPIIVKPRRASCGYGLWILDSNIDLMQKFQYPGHRFPISAFLSVLSEAMAADKAIPPYIMMQFLEGEDYSVDALATHGNPLFIIPRRRIKAVDGISQVCEILPDPKVREVVGRIIRKFNLHLNINVQLKYPSILEGQPLVYEINPRISGTIAVNDAAGVNLLYYGILLALGKQFPMNNSTRVQRTKIFRYWSEKYTYLNEWFLP